MVHYSLTFILLQSSYPSGYERLELVTLHCIPWPTFKVGYFVPQIMSSDDLDMLQLLVDISGLLEG